MITVDDLKNKFGVLEDQELAIKLERSPQAVSNWRRTGVPAAIERRANELLKEMGVIAEPSAQDMVPDPARMTLEEKLKWCGFGPREIRQIKEIAKLSEEEQDELLKKLSLENIEKGRY